MLFDMTSIIICKLTKLVHVWIKFANLKFWLNSSLEVKFPKISKSYFCKIEFSRQNFAYKYIFEG